MTARPYLTFAAQWCAGFRYADLTALIANLKATNAFEESPVQYKLALSGQKYVQPTAAHGVNHQNREESSGVAS